MFSYRNCRVFLVTIKKYWLNYSLITGIIFINTIIGVCYNNKPFFFYKALYILELFLFAFGMFFLFNKISNFIKHQFGSPGIVDICENYISL